MILHALLHPRLSIIMMHDAILRSGFRAASVTHRDDDDDDDRADLSRVCNVVVCNINIAIFTI